VPAAATPDRSVATLLLRPALFHIWPANGNGIEDSWPAAKQALKDHPELLDALALNYLRRSLTFSKSSAMPMT
jgi:hypothetical protein